MNDLGDGGMAMSDGTLTEEIDVRRQQLYVARQQTILANPRTAERAELIEAIETLGEEEYRTWKSDYPDVYERLTEHLPPEPAALD